MADHWKSLADLLGSPGMDAPEAPPPESSTGDVASAAPQSKSPARELPADPTRSSTPRSVAESKPAPAKRRSTWDSLTRMFGIESQSPQESAVEPESPSEVPLETSSRKEVRARDTFAGHSTGEPTQDEDTETARVRFEKLPSAGKSQSALDEMFEGVPRKTEQDWRADSSLRIVDDVSWEDDSSERMSHSEREQREEAPADGDEGERGRRRKRRRRSPRGRDVQDDTVQSDSPVAGKVGWSDNLDDEPLPAAEPTWASDDALSGFDGDEPAGEVERRSSRRRRRGRVREREDAAPVEFDPDRTQRRPRDAAQSREHSRREPTSSDVSGQRQAETERNAPRHRDRIEKPPRERIVRDDRERTSVDRARPTENREFAKSLERTKSPPISEDVDEDFDENLIDGDEGDNKHRKIPTWAEALESIVANNMENHRRHEGSRDHHGPRGRPRGRR